MRAYFLDLRIWIDREVSAAIQVFEDVLIL
jgi:hypothetical protein